MQKKKRNYQRNDQRRKNPKKNLKLEKGSYLVCGRNAVLDSLKTGKVNLVYINQELKGDPKIGEIVQQAKNFDTKVNWINKEEFDKFVREDKSQGVAALCKKSVEISLADFLHKVEDQENVCFVILTDISYEQNMGAILRTCDAAGVDGVIVSSRIKNTDSNVVRRVSMGASESVNVFNQNIFIALRMLKERGFEIVGVESFGKEHYINSSLSGRIALLFGGEDKSLTQPLVDECDKILSIPMLGIVTSLNVSVSVAIIIYERLRQVVSKGITNN
jgi:23S rRNA (guanosine2251-2'-O)-methyltransferase